MDQKRRRRRTAAIVALLATGAIVLQVGPVCSLFAGSGVAAFDTSLLLDSNEMLFGVFKVCGTPDVQYVDSSGNPVGTVQNGADDLIFHCPVTAVTSTSSSGGGGT
jgi:hypothetical protein